MELSKPSSEIATSSKANSDIAVHYKANSDIDVTTLSKLISNSKSLSESEENTRIREKAAASENISETDRKTLETETLSKEDASKPVLSHEPVVTSANKPVVANAKVVKRGKLVHRPNSIDNNFTSYSFVSRNSFENVLEVEPAEEIHQNISLSHSMFEPEKLKLHTKIEHYRSKHKTPEIIQLSCSPNSKNQVLKHYETSPQRVIGFVKPIVKPNQSNLQKLKSDLKLQKSKSFLNTSKKNMPANNKNCCRTSSFQTNLKSPVNINQKSTLKSYDGKFSREKLVKIPTISHLDDIENHLENMPECGILKNRFSPIKSHIGSYICSERRCSKNLKYSNSFQNQILRDTKIINSFEQPQFLLSRSFSSRYNLNSRSIQY